MADIRVRKSESFDDARRADQEFWRAATPEGRIAAVEELRQHWAKLNGVRPDGIQKTVRVLRAGDPSAEM